MRNFSSMLRERKGRRETMGRMMSETRELATEVKEEAKLFERHMVSMGSC
jgi:hypothetical protein